ncbi:hypothetical protein WIW50_17290 [Flavobacteriaceae bacterium 3-367]|uniref:hypothetical protein n=1 Tax=Eudoraea algarum TaxID=3417568 RepID=UPI0032943BEB
MQTTRLSLAEFKTKAEKIQASDVLEKVQGGGQGDCHGFWGQAHKLALQIAEAMNAYH